VDLISDSASYFNFDDDGPTLTVSAEVSETEMAALTTMVDETVGEERLAEGEIDTDGNLDGDDPGLGRATTTVVGGLVNLFAALGGDYGQDGEGSTSGVLSFVGDLNQEWATNLAATDGGAITLVRTSATMLSGVDEDGDTVFTIAIVNIGTVQAPEYQLQTSTVQAPEYQLQTTLYEALVHPDTDTFDETVQLLLSEEGAVQLQYVVTRVDGDGDSVTESATVDLISDSASYFNFDDDGPTRWCPCGAGCRDTAARAA